MSDVPKIEFSGKTDICIGGISMAKLIKDFLSEIYLVQVGSNNQEETDALVKRARECLKLMGIEK